MSGVDRGIILLAMALGAVALGFRLSWQDYWWDEEVTLMFSRMSWRELLIEYWGLDTHRPLYYALQKGWNGIFGESMVAVRSLPMVIALLMVPVFFLISREVNDRTTAALCVLFLVTSPMFVHLGREVRMYGLLTLAISTASLFAIRLARTVQGSDEGRMKPGQVSLVLGLSVSLALAFYAQAIAILVPFLFAAWGVLAVVLRLLPPRFLWLFLPASGLYLVMILPGLMPFLEHSSHTIGDRFWIPEPTLKFVYGQITSIYPYPKWLKPVMALMLIWGVWALRRRPLPGLLLILLVMGFPLLLILVSFFKPVFMHRVVAWTSILSVLILAAGLAQMGPRLRVLGVLVVLAAHAGATWNVYPREPQISPLANLSETLASFDPGRDVLVLGDTDLEPRLRWDYPTLFDGKIYAFLPSEEHRRVIDPAFRAKLVLATQPEEIDGKADRLFLLRNTGVRLDPQTASRLDAAFATVIADRGLVETHLSGPLQLDIYALP
jgi:4-amino-4-deoxy-L-arabinose transferase-like glycosyltransferase